MGFLEIFGAGLDLFVTYLCVRATLWVWPLTLVSSLLNIWLYHHLSLYADTGLAVFYGASAIYGWIHWKRGTEDNQELAITRLDWRSTMRLGTITIASVGIVGTFLSEVSLPEVAYWDASAVVMSLVGQWLLCQKKIETWVVCFVADVIYTLLYFYKGIPVYGLSMLIYLGLAVWGFIGWYQQLAASKRQLETKAQSYSMEYGN
jgi:nicotinamide mononucleotide transporter